MTLKDLFFIYYRCFKKSTHRIKFLYKNRIFRTTCAKARKNLFLNTLNPASSKALFAANTDLIQKNSASRLAMWLLFLSVAVLQIGSYLLLNKLGWPKAKWLVLLILLLLHYRVFPPLFMPALPEGEACGMPVLGVILGFWVIGGISALLIHFSFLVLTRKHEAQR